MYGNSYNTVALDLAVRLGLVQSAAAVAPSLPCVALRRYSFVADRGRAQARSHSALEVARITKYYVGTTYVYVVVQYTVKTVYKYNYMAAVRRRAQLYLVVV